VGVGDADEEAVAHLAERLRRSLTWRITGANIVGAVVIYTYIQVISFTISPAGVASLHRR